MQQLEQIFLAVELNIMWGKLKVKVLRKVHISRLFQTIFSIILLNFPKKLILASLKIWNINMFSQFSSKESAHCWLIFL